MAMFLKGRQYFCPQCRALVPWYLVLQLLPERPAFHYVATTVSHRVRRFIPLEVV